MKYAILVTGILGALVFIFSIYTFAAQPQKFKPVAYAFLGLAIIFFILVVIKKVKEEKEYRKKISGKKEQMDEESG